MNQKLVSTIYPTVNQLHSSVIYLVQENKNVLNEVGHYFSERALSFNIERIEKLEKICNLYAEISQFDIEMKRHAWKLKSKFIKDLIKLRTLHFNQIEELRG